MPEPRPLNVRILSTLMVLYGVGVLIWGMYTSLTARGLAGYLMARQMEWFGIASLAVTYCLDIAVLLVVPLVLAAIVGATVWPALGEALTGLFVSSSTKPGPRPVAAPSAPSAGWFRWSTIFTTAVVMLGLTGALSAVLYFLNVREHSLGIVEFNLDAKQAPLPARMGFVKVTGHIVPPMATAYREGDSMHVIVPLTDGAWTPGTPVLYFVHYEQLDVSRTNRLSLPTEFRQAGAAQFGGRFAGRLPSFAQREFERKGLKIDSDYKIVEWVNLSGADVPTSDSHLVALIVGGIVCFAILGPMIGIKLRMSFTRSPTSA